MVVIGSHYDTVRTSPGVDDNGSGMTALLQAVKLITSPGTATLLFSTSLLVNSQAAQAHDANVQLSCERSAERDIYGRHAYTIT